MKEQCISYMAEYGCGWTSSYSCLTSSGSSHADMSLWAQLSAIWALPKGLLMGSTPMGSARKRVKNEIFEFWSRFGSDFVSFGPGEVGIV